MGIHTQKSSSLPKVTLINAGKSSRFAVQEPLNLCYLAAYLEKHDIEVQIIDQLGGDNLEEQLEIQKPDIVGITATTPVIYDAYDVADLCRKKGIHVVMGGIHPTFLPEESLKHADQVVTGEGENALLDIVFKKASEQIVSRPPVHNLDDIPMPSRHLLKMERYYYCKKYNPFILHLPYAKSNQRILHVLTSRGCSYAKCLFCHNSLKKTAYRCNSPERVIQEIKSLIETYNMEAFYFVEDNFFGNQERARKICELMVENGLDHIAWGAATRSEEVDYETMVMAKNAGCRMVTIGFESGSQRILEVLNKGNTLTDADKACETIRKAGLMVHGNIIIGNPSETLAEIEESRDFLKRSQIYSPEVYFFTPYPGTQAWDFLQKENKVSSDFDWSRFNQEEIVFNLSAVPTRILEKMRTKIYMSYYLHHKKYAFELFCSILKHPKIPAIKLYKTFKPYIKSFFH